MEEFSSSSSSSESNQAGRLTNQLGNQHNDSYELDDGSDNHRNARDQQSQVNVEDTYSVLERDVKYYERFRTHVVKIILRIEFSEIEVEEGLSKEERENV